MLIDYTTAILASKEIDRFKTLRSAHYKQKLRETYEQSQTICQLDEQLWALVYEQS